MRIFNQAIRLFLVLSMLTGLLYPAAMTTLCQVVFPSEANGSLIVRERIAVGSALVGQKFTSDQYFWGRPSALANPYDPSNSSGSNLGPTNPALINTITKKTAELIETTHTGMQVPVDLVTSSASGLDPHISVAAAMFQIPRIAKSRGLSEERIRICIEETIELPWLGVFGTKRVNVLKLNLRLDEEARRST